MILGLKLLVPPLTTPLPKNPRGWDHGASGLVSTWRLGTVDPGRGAWQCHTPFFSHLAVQSHPLLYPLLVNMTMGFPEFCEPL